MSTSPRQSSHDRSASPERQADASRSPSRSTSPAPKKERTVSEEQDPEVALNFNWKSLMLDALEDNDLRREDLSDDTWGLLEGLEEKIACNVVKRVSESNLRNVRNLDGFTKSILNRITEHGLDIGSGSLADLERSVRTAINGHVDSGTVSASDFSDLQVITALKGMTAPLAIEAVDQFCKSNLENVRNKTGFIMSIIRRVKDDASARSNQGDLRDSRRSSGYCGGGRYDRYDRYDRSYDDRYAKDRYDRSDRYDRGSGDRRHDDRRDRYDRGGGTRYR